VCHNRSLLFWLKQKWIEIVSVCQKELEEIQNIDVILADAASFNKIDQF